MRLHELFSKAKLDFPREFGGIEISGIVTDSRHAKSGSLFVCIKGEHTDGHAHIREAIKAGATVVVAEQVRLACVGGAAATIYVENTRKAVALLYHAWYGNPSEKLTVVGVTGTNGKTSVCGMLKHIFEHSGYRCGSIGTLGCISASGELLSGSDDPYANMTTPEPETLYRVLAEMVRDGVQYVFMEVTSHALAQERTAPIVFDTAVFTNLTQDHLDYHRNMETYFQSKSRLFAQSRYAVVCTEDAYGERLYRSQPCGVSYAVSCSADAVAENVRLLGDVGSEFEYLSASGRCAVRVGVPGRFFVLNALACCAVAEHYGMDIHAVSEALQDFDGVSGRMERVSLPDDVPFAVYIDYAHTPDAMEKLLLGIREMRETGRIILVFGCGGERDRGKRPQMARMACAYADVVIVTSDNARGEDPERIFSDILRGMNKEKEYVLIRDRAEAIAYAVREARAGDCLLLSGKGHEQYQLDKTGKHPFDEKKLVREAVSHRYEGTEERGTS